MSRIFLADQAKLAFDLRVSEIERRVLEHVPVYIRSVHEPITAQDKILIRRAEEGIEKHYERNLHQVYAVSRGASGKIYEAKQIDVPGGKGSMCAEQANALLALVKGDPLEVLATAHKMKVEKGGFVHLANPCTLCIARLLQAYPELRIIVWFQDRPWKVPLRALAIFLLERESSERPKPTPGMRALEAKISPARSNYLRAISAKLAEEDEHLIALAKATFVQRGERKRSQWLCLGTDREGNLYEGRQRDYPTGQFNIYAEDAMVIDADTKMRVPETCVTVGRMSEGADIIIHDPPLTFCERASHSAPVLFQIIDLDGDLLRIPLRGGIVLPAKQRKDNGNGIVDRW